MNDNPFVPKRNPFDVPPVVATAPDCSAHPAIAELEKRKRYRRHSFVAVATAGMGFLALAMLATMVIRSQSNPSRQATARSRSMGNTIQINVEFGSTAPIRYTVLEQYRPWSDQDSLGLSILIDKRDATKGNIERLVRFLGANWEGVEISIFQDRLAKQEEDEDPYRDYTDAFDEGFLAYYVKNYTGNGNYQGVNQIRWFQQKGQLQHLLETTTQIR